MLKKKQYSLGKKSGNMCAIFLNELSYFQKIMPTAQVLLKCFETDNVMSMDVLLEIYEVNSGKNA